MPYIGSSASPLPVNFAAVQAQSFNGTGSQTAFTLNRTIPGVTAIEVLVNNVQQSPYDGSYSVSGTTLTFSEAPSAGTNNVYVVYRDQSLGSLVDESAYRKAEVDAFAVKLTGNQTVAGVKTFSSDPVMGVSGLTGTLAKARLPAGNVLQVVNALSSTIFTTTSGSYVDVGFSASITPTSASSKVLVVVHANGLLKYIGNAQNTINIRVANGSGVLVQYIANGVSWNNTNSYAYGSASASFLHEPNTTSAYTYKLQIMSWVAGQTAAFNWYNDTQQTTSTITLMEIAA